MALENGIGDPNVINAGDPIDVCPGNGIDDITGALRAPPDTTPEPAPETTVPPDPTTPDTVAPGTALPSGVEAQQAKLNELFANTGPVAADRRRAVGPPDPPAALRRTRRPQHPGQSR